VSDTMSSWQRRGVWDGIAVPGVSGATDREPGVIVTPRHDLSVAYVIGGEDQDVSARFVSRFAIEPPQTPRIVAGDMLDLVWSGPSQWLALSGNPRMPSELAAQLAGVAAISDQTDARAILGLSGRNVRDALAKGCPVDLHPRAFRRGDTVITAIGGVGVQVWWPESEDALHLSVPRSMAGSFWSWLLPSAQEFGVKVLPPGRR